MAREIVKIVDMNRRMPEDACWLWTSSHRTRDGYGRKWVKGKRVMAHRWMYERHIGPIPNGMQLDHLCRVRLCVNPRHLEPVTLQENRRRGAEAQSACRRGGHPLDYVTPDGRRGCSTCRREASRRYRSTHA